MEDDDDFAISMSQAVHQPPESKETVELIKAFQPELEIDKIDIQAVAYAGLCHDLGHGPFSHVFENEFLSVRLAGQEFPKHEENSAKMFDYLVDYNQLEIDADVISRVKSLITSAEEEHGVMPKSWTHGKSFLREIVANGRNRFMRVIDDEICFKASEVGNIYELFHTRTSLHQRVYTHRKAKAIEFMVVDALLEADIAMNGAISQSVYNIEDFMTINDTILQKLEYPNLVGKSDCDGRCSPACHGCASVIAQNLRIDYTKGGLNPVDYVHFYQNYDDDVKFNIPRTKKILHRLRTRDLYKYVNEFTVPEDRLEKGGEKWKKVTPADITTCQLSGSLREDDVIVQ
eukprot:gene8007-9517_t